MIALIRETRGHTFGPMMQLPKYEQSLAFRRVFTEATLVVVPVNLFDQWEKEITKFARDLKVLAIPNLGALKKLRIADLMEADVVLVTFSFFFSMAYQQFLDPL